MKWFCFVMFIITLIVTFADLVCLAYDLVHHMPSEAIVASSNLFILLPSAFMFLCVFIGYDS